MARYNSKKLTLSAFMALVFFGLLIYMFLPHFGEGSKMNALEYSDQLFNSISKGSSNYIPGIMTQAAKFDGKSVDIVLHFEDSAADAHGNPATVGTEVAAKAGAIFSKVADVQVQGGEMALKADMGALVTAALTDAQDMFNNRGEAVKGRYGMDEREALFMWWMGLKTLDKELKLKGGRENVAMAKIVDTAIKKGVEVGYNYYGIQPESAGDRAGILTFALVFYVVYTLWWGMCIYYMFEGIGLVMSKGHKQES
ncbi:hypothetical protein [Desulfocurvus sp. DL9XJH121]